MPSAAAPVAITKDSPTNWRINRPVVAPSAVRTATSRDRLAARAKYRLMTFTTASRNKTPVAANAMSTTGPRSPTMASRSGCMTKTRPLSKSGYLSAKASHIGLSVPWTASAETPDASRT